MILPNPRFGGFHGRKEDPVGAGKKHTHREKVLVCLESFAGVEKKLFDGSSVVCLVAKSISKSRTFEENGQRAREALEGSCCLG